jgi:hypothetical protein
VVAAQSFAFEAQPGEVVYLDAAGPLRTGIDLVDLPSGWDVIARYPGQASPGGDPMTPESLKRLSPNLYSLIFATRHAATIESPSTETCETRPLPVLVNPSEVVVVVASRYANEENGLTCRTENRTELPQVVDLEGTSVFVDNVPDVFLVELDGQRGVKSGTSTVFYGTNSGTHHLTIRDAATGWVPVQHILQVPERHDPNLIEGVRREAPMGARNYGTLHYDYGPIVAPLLPAERGVLRTTATGIRCGRFVDPVRVGNAFEGVFSRPVLDSVHCEFEDLGPAPGGKRWVAIYNGDLGGFVPAALDGVELRALQEAWTPGVPRGGAAPGDAAGKSGLARAVAVTTGIVVTGVVAMGAIYHREIAAWLADRRRLGNREAGPAQATTSTAE